MFSKKAETSQADFIVFDGEDPGVLNQSFNSNEDIPEGPGGKCLSFQLTLLWESFSFL